MRSTKIERLELVLSPMLLHNFIYLGFILEERYRLSLVLVSRYCLATFRLVSLQQVFQRLVPIHADERGLDGRKRSFFRAGHQLILHLTKCHLFEERLIRVSCLERHLLFVLAAELGRRTCSLVLSSSTSLILGRNRVQVDFSRRNCLYRCVLQITVMSRRRRHVYFGEHLLLESQRYLCVLLDAYRLCPYVLWFFSGDRSRQHLHHLRRDCINR